MRLIFIICCFTAQILIISGSPTVEEEIALAAGNRTLLNTKTASSWVEGSNVRGTSDILLSCIVTLIACVSTAIHLNVPPPGEGRWHLIRSKSKWIATALLAPEIVLYCAGSQLVKARALVQELNKLRTGENTNRAKSRDGREDPAGDLEIGEVCVAQKVLRAIANARR